jgi:3-deoxy-7-phosphoheptulonate synthase
MLKNTDDLRIRELKELLPPAHLIREFACSEAASDVIYGARQAMHRILHGMDDRLIVIIGPCSIHDTRAAWNTPSCSRCSATASRASSRS